MCLLLPSPTGNDCVEHGALDVVMHNLRVKLIHELLSRHEDGDDPQETGEQEVKGAEQQVKPPDR